MTAMIPGFHGVRRALTGEGIRIKEVWIAEGKDSGRIREIIQIAREQDIPIRFKKGAELSRILPGVAHQGIVALAGGFTYTDIDQLVGISLQHPGQGLLIAVDHITDEGNLGALIRTAAFFGAHGMIISKDRCAGISANVLKKSSGGFAHLPIARVVNLGRALDILEKKGFWIIGSSGDGDLSIYRFDWHRDVVLVLGNEQRGLSPSVRKRCHQVVSIPPVGYDGSLNVAVAGGVVLSEVIRQRKALQGP